MSAPVMQHGATGGTSSTARRTGLVLSTLVVLFLVVDTAVKLVGAKAAIDSTVQLGFRAEQVALIGIIEAICLVLYLVPRTAAIGAILSTGYLGGAIAIQLRAGNPLASHVLFPLYIAALLWSGLYLRDPRVRALIRGHAG